MIGSLVTQYLRMMASIGEKSPELGAMAAAIASCTSFHSGSSENGLWRGNLLSPRKRSKPVSPLAFHCLSQAALLSGACCSAERTNETPR